MNQTTGIKEAGGTKQITGRKQTAGMSRAAGMYQTKSPIRRLWAYTGKQHIWLYITVLFSVISAALSLFIAIYLGRSADMAVTGDFGQFIRTAVYLGIVLLLHLPVNTLKSYTAGRFGENSLYSIREKTVAHIQSLPVSYFDKHPSADLTSRLNNDTGLIQQFLQGSLSDLISQPVLFAAAAVFLFFLSWKLSIFNFTVVPVLMVLAMNVTKRMEKYTKMQQEALADVNAVSQDMIEGMTVAKSFLLEDELNRKHDRAVGNALNKSLKVVLIQAIVSPLNILVQLLPFVFVFAYGGYLVIKSEMSFGELISFINLMNYVSQPLYSLPRAFASLRGASAAAGRILEIWDEKAERSDGEKHPVRTDIPVISFENVAFSYDEQKELINDLSFEVQPGMTAALVGPSGCGKSTVIRLINQFCEHQSGTIRLYGEDIKEWSLDEARALISWVSQDNYLYPRSIYENISYGKSDASRDEVIAAAKAAGIHDFIESLPEGYDTMAGERGVKLSGGQKQRIAIARAILKDAPILLLDEATSALDAETEHEVQLALEQLMKGRTCLVIAHRLSTIKSASVIFVMDNGRIIEQGSHDELLREGTLYKRLYYMQYAGQSSEYNQACQA